jgi:hypothetical protein
MQPITKFYDHPARGCTSTEYLEPLEADQSEVSGQVFAHANPDPLHVLSKSGSTFIE